MREINFLYTHEFRRSRKKLCKKYKSLPQDFTVFCKALKVQPTGHPPQIVAISGLGSQINMSFYKVRKFAVRSMRTKNSGIRIVYAYDAQHEHIEFIEFVEIYQKNDQTNHDIEKIQKLYTDVSSLPSQHASEEGPNT